MNPADLPPTILAAASGLLARRVGMRIDLSHAGRLARSVVEEATAHGLDVVDYSTRLESSPALFQRLVDRISVQETSFFRDAGQIEAFRVHVLPTLTPPVRVWSAGCSNGQEPYTLAMVLAEQGVRNWQVTATDIATAAVERTARARYSARETRGLEPSRRARHFRAQGAEWEVVPTLRARVDVVRHNLVADPPPFAPGQCDVVFCRNVLIYLSEDATVVLLERLARWMRPPGWLFVGYSEFLAKLTDAFELARLGSSFAYRLRQAESPNTGRTRPAQHAATTPRPAAAPRPGPPAPSAPPPPTGSHLLVVGQDALRDGDAAAAVVAFRKYAYLAPHDAMAHLHLGLALEAAGDHGAARRAFAVARATLGSGGRAPGLEGDEAAAVVRMLDAKLGPR